jgi:hypothetical protein
MTREEARAYVERKAVELRSSAAEETFMDRSEQAREMDLWMSVYHARIGQINVEAEPAQQFAVQRPMTDAECQASADAALAAFRAAFPKPAGSPMNRAA